MANIGDAAFSQGDVMRRLRDLERQVRELAAGRRLENASVGTGGIRIFGGGGITLEGGGGVSVADGGDIQILDDGELTVQAGSIHSANFDGDMADGDPGTVGWGLGNALLALQGQFVGPVAFGSDQDYTQNFGITTTLTARATATITVPDWADEAIVVGLAGGTGGNTTGALDYLYVKIRIDGVDSVAMIDGAGNNEFAGSTKAFSRVYNPGSTITVQAMLQTGFATWPTLPPPNEHVNSADISAFAIFRKAS